MNKFLRIVIYSWFSPLSYLFIILKAFNAFLSTFFTSLIEIFCKRRFKKGDVVFEKYDGKIGVIIKCRGNVFDIQFSERGVGTFNSGELKKYNMIED